MDYNNQWKRKSGTKVALNVESHILLRISNCVVRCFGITKDPITNDFIMVMELKNGSLRQYLRPLKQPNADELQGLLWKLYRDIDKEDPVIYGQVKEADDIN
ncbi:kinase-like domain-containing protein [Rhizophagus irregularis DAOM 181602=DAOM 197198]|nr:kinase-like domain-containing protein [Rhizophagus irregularis DAOM 181602=DAOM 197198]